MSRKDEQAMTDASHTAHADHPDDDYAGPATLTLDGRALPVQVRLVAVHQPVDGRVHWSGRIAANPVLHQVLGGRSSDVRLSTPGGQAAGKVGDPDPWGRYRVSGTGRPPFTPDPVPLGD
jgi:hypothetical protein